MRNIKNILITGGSGFIGSNFINLILNNKDGYPHHDINIINIDKLTYAASLENNKNYKDDQRYKFFHGDINDEKLVSSILNKFGIEGFKIASADITNPLYSSS